MPTSPDNPYEKPATVATEKLRPNFGKTIAILSFPIATIPSCIMLYWLGKHFFALYGSPTTSYRPIIWIYGLGLSVLNMIICIPLPLLAERFGTKADADLSIRCLFIAPVPFVLGVFGPFFVCWATGSSFGT